MVVCRSTIFTVSLSAGASTKHLHGGSGVAIVDGHSSIYFFESDMARPPESELSRNTRDTAYEIQVLSIFKNNCLWNRATRQERDLTRAGAGSVEDGWRGVDRGQRTLSVRLDSIRRGKGSKVGRSSVGQGCVTYGAHRRKVHGWPSGWRRKKERSGMIKLRCIKLARGELTAQMCSSLSCRPSHYSSGVVFEVDNALFVEVVRSVQSKACSLQRMDVGVHGGGWGLRIVISGRPDGLVGCSAGSVFGGAAVLRGNRLRPAATTLSAKMSNG
ncbi:hypothetical protein B0H19DRAFT_1239057 [Mycena capillaripes]|nr:hypothetical protein B0H19DRAFT_1239057 [Mycena capillaripes]